MSMNCRSEKLGVDFFLSVKKMSSMGKWYKMAKWKTNRNIYEEEGSKITIWICNNKQQLTNNPIKNLKDNNFSKKINLMCISNLFVATSCIISWNLQNLCDYNTNFTADTAQWAVLISLISYFFTYYFREDLPKKRMFTFGHCPNQGGEGPCPKVLALFSPSTNP